MNGVAERINRTLLDLTRSMLKSAHLPPKFWAEAVTTAAYIKNRVCHSTISDQIPFTVWTDKIPSVRHLKVYGCLAYARLPDQRRKKLDDKAAECIFVGYATQTRGYRLWCPQKGDVIVTKYVKFTEDKIGYEWIYKEVPQKFKYNEVWPNDEDDSTTEEMEPAQKQISYEKKSPPKSQKRTNAELGDFSEREMAEERESTETPRRGRPKRKLVILTEEKGSLKKYNAYVKKRKHRRKQAT